MYDDPGEAALRARSLAAALAAFDRLGADPRAARIRSGQTADSTA